MSAGITHVSDAERALLPTIARLEGEALVLRELLRRALDPLETIDRGEFESDEEYHLLCALRADIQKAIAPTQVTDVVQKGMF